MNIQNLVLDINKKPFQTITANVGEVASRFVKISIVDKSIPVDLTGVTVSIYAKKPDGKKVFNNVTIEDKTNGIILAELTSQILAVEGLVKLTLLLVKNDSKLCSKQFLLNVDSTIVDDTAIESTNEFTALTTALGKVNNIDSRFESINSSLDKKANKDDVAKISVGTPLFASSITGMIDTTKNYVNTSDGYIYIYSGGIWTKSTVQYQSTGIADKSVTSEKLDNKIISFIKITDDIFNGGVISSSTTLDNTIKTGYYVVTACEQLPNPSKTYLMEVKRSSLGNGRYYIIQHLMDIDTGQLFIRNIVEGSVIPNIFKKLKNNIEFDDINNNMLASQSLITDNTTLLTTLKNGTYLATSCADLPDPTKTYYLDVDNYIFGGRTYTKQAIVTDEGDTYIRFIDSKYPTTSKSFIKIGVEKQLSNKKIVCFGDSIIEFGDIPKRIGDITGATVYNVGFGGCRMSATDTTDYVEMSMCKLADTITTKDFTKLEQSANNLAATGDDNISIVNRLKGIDFANIDIITISYGVNDFLSNIPIGDNINSLDTTTFVGSINYVIKTILSKYPHIKIYFFTPIFKMKYGDSDITPNKNNNYLYEFAQRELEACNKNHIPCKDMYKNCNINKYNSTYYFTDELHPNANGNKLLGEIYSGYIMSN